MGKLNRLCPVAWYIGCTFAQIRKAKHIRLNDLAERVPCSQQTLSSFEQGQHDLDLILITKLEELLQLSYAAYKPPISYFGFLGFKADENAMLRRSKQVVKQIKSELLHPEVRRQIEKSLLAVRFTPLRGMSE